MLPIAIAPLPHCPSSDVANGKREKNKRKRLDAYQAARAIHAASGLGLGLARKPWAAAWQPAASDWRRIIELATYVLAFMASRSSCIRSGAWQMLACCLQCLCLARGGACRGLLICRFGRGSRRGGLGRICTREHHGKRVVLCRILHGRRSWLRGHVRRGMGGGRSHVGRQLHRPIHQRFKRGARDGCACTVGHGHQHIVLAVVGQHITGQGRSIVERARFQVRAAGLAHTAAAQGAVNACNGHG